MLLVLAACTPPATTPTTSPRHGTSTVPDSTQPTSPVTDLVLILDEVEALAVDDGVRVEVGDASGQVLGSLDRDHPRLTVATVAPRLTISYVTADDRQDSVVWEQTVAGPVTIVRQPWRGGEKCVVALPDGSIAPTSLAWQAGGSSEEYLSQLDGAHGAVTVVSPVWWRLNDDGSVTSSVDRGYATAVHDRNVAIWPALAGFDADVHHLLFSDAERREALATGISEQARKSGADGVNIDIEGYREEDADRFLLWVEELTRLVHSWGGTVSHDLVPRSDSWDVAPRALSFWSTAPPRAGLSRLTDCTVLMAYDQYNRHRPAGPVASPRWVEDVLIHALRHSDPGELVLGIPFYGRVWDPADLEHPAAVGIGRLEELIGQGNVSFDRFFDLDRVVLTDGRFFWAETPEGLRHRLDLVSDYGLAGWGAWRFGFDSPEIWEMLG